MFNGASIVTRKVGKTGLVSWLSNKCSMPIQWQQNRIGVIESNGALFLHNLATVEVIAEHKLSLEKTLSSKNRELYRDKPQAIETLELRLQERLGETAIVAIAALLKAMMSRNYKDPLPSCVTILKPGLLQRAVVDC